MKNLTKIDSPPSYVEWHKSIVSSKNNPRRARLESLHPAIEVRFDEFETAVAANTLAAIAEDTILQGHLDDLQNCYNAKTKKLSEMLRGIGDKQIAGLLKWCPYCGLTSPGSYDHYLPKELYPEFSVNPHNLISCCTTCNSSKGARWLLEGERIFIHFYSDQLPVEKFLFVELHHEGGAFSSSFRIEKPSNFNDTDWKVIESHFQKLNLVDKYRDNANDEIVHSVNICASHLKNGGTDIRAFIEDLVSEEEGIFGRNHWRNVLMRSLALDENFAAVVAAKVQATI